MKMVYYLSIENYKQSMQQNIIAPRKLAFLNKGVLNEFVKVTVPEGYSISCT